MDTPVIVAVISAAAAIVVPAISFYLTKSKERQADWQRYKFELYKDFIQSLSGIVRNRLDAGGQQTLRGSVQHVAPDCTEGRSGRASRFSG